MVIARRALKFRQIVVNTLKLGIQRYEKILSTMLLGLCFAVLGSSGGCGETAKPVTSPAANQVYSYFGSPFSVPGSSLSLSSSTFDHAANQIGVSSFITTPSNAQVPTAIIIGNFETAGTGFMKITENFATTSGVIVPQNPALTGAWAVEIPGAGALANLLSVNSTGVRAAPAAMAENTACPNFPDLAYFLYVTVPTASLTNDTADYGGVTLSSQGSEITFRTQPYVIGVPPQQGFNATGGCSNTNLGALTAYPLNSFGSPSNLELISISASGLLVSSYNRSVSGTSPGAFGGGTGVLGVPQPHTPLDVHAVVGAHYNGFLYAPLNRVPETYDITMLASAFGDHPATSQACSALQSSLAANNGQGAGTVPALPSPNSLYGGEFLTTTGTGTVNDPTGANGSENCDVVIDLGAQSAVSSGLFPNATVFIGSTFPPFSASNPWTCGGACAVSFPAAAVVGSVQGRYVIFVSASASSSPPASLPNDSGGRPAQPVGIYLFQKTQ
jgi:hypothetical protein